MLGKRLFGSRDYTPKEAKKRFELEQVLLKVFQQSGFQQVILPTLELFDSLKNLGGLVESECVTFLDQNREKVVLRPDPTAAIARLISTRMQESFPLKLCYFQSVFRKQKDHNIQEWFQAGIEYIGSCEENVEVEVLSLCIKALQALGLNEFQIDINHPKQFQAYTERDKVALLDQDYLTLGSLPKRIALKDWQGDNPSLVSLKAASLSEHIYVNDGLVKNLKYYDGIFFEITAPGFPFVLASGGRYDQLLKKVQVPQEAIGFAIHLNRIQHALEQINHES